MPGERSGGERGLDETLIDALGRYFARYRKELACVYLYGSVARGRARETSDLDLGLLFARPPERRLGGLPSRIEDELEAALRQPVEVVTLNAAPPDLVHRVLRDGILVHEADRSARVRFEVAARNAYFDLQPILREYRRGGTAGP